MSTTARRTTAATAAPTTTVVHLFGTLDRGGAETRMLEELSTRQGRERHVLVSLSGRAGALDGAFQAAGADVVLHRLSVGFPLWFVRFLRATRATHVHSHVHLTSGWFLLLARAAGVPRRIAHLHSVGDGRSSTGARRGYRSASRLALALAATDVVSVSTAVADAVVGGDLLLRRRSSVLYERVDDRALPLADPRRDGPIELAFVGRLDAEKDPTRAVAIVAALAARGVRSHLRLVGLATAAQQRALLGQARALGVAAQVDLLGVRSDVPELLATSDLLLSTSRREGLPGVVLEAAGIPCVVSAIPANEEAGRWLAGVVTMPLDASDDAWCDAIEDVVDAREARFAPQHLRDAFRRSPFALAGDDPGLDRLWS